jgi:hypothetical protein
VKHCLGSPQDERASFGHPSESASRLLFLDTSGTQQAAADGKMVGGSGFPLVRPSRRNEYHQESRLVPCHSKSISKGTSQHNGRIFLWCVRQSRHIPWKGIVRESVMVSSSASCSDDSAVSEVFLVQRSHLPPSVVLVGLTAAFHIRCQRINYFRKNGCFLFFVDLGYIQARLDGP